MGRAGAGARRRHGRRLRRHHRAAGPAPDPGAAGLIARARNADLVVCTGAELEIGWLPVLLRQSGNAEGAARPARLLRGGRLRAHARGADAARPRRRRRACRPATRTSRPIRATSRSSPRRSASACAQIDPAHAARLRARAARTSTQRWQRRSRAGRAGGAAQGRGDRLAAQGLGLPRRLARPEGGRRCSSPSPASPPGSAYLAELLDDMPQGAPAKHGHLCRLRGSAAVASSSPSSAGIPGRDAALHGRRHRRGARICSASSTTRSTRLLARRSEA